MSYTETPIVPIGLLDAVNQLLEDCQRRPVETLTAPNMNPEAASAKRALDVASREIQAQGWSFNTSDDRELLPHPTTGEIQLPANTLIFTALNKYRALGLRIVQRGKRLYNMDQGGTFNIGQPIKGRLVELLEFEDLPEAARWYITNLAGFRYSTPRRPNNANARFTQNTVSSSKAGLEQYELNTEDRTLADDSPHFRLHRKR